MYTQYTYTHTHIPHHSQVWGGRLDSWRDQTSKAGTAAICKETQLASMYTRTHTHTHTHARLHTRFEGTARARRCAYVNELDAATSSVPGACAL